jgi:hypothetical protein
MTISGHMYFEKFPFLGKSEARKHLIDLGLEWDNVEMDLTEIERENVISIQLVQNRSQ